MRMIAFHFGNKNNVTIKNPVQPPNQPPRVQENASESKQPLTPEGLNLKIKDIKESASKNRQLAQTEELLKDMSSYVQHISVQCRAAKQHQLEQIQKLNERTQWYKTIVSASSISSPEARQALTQLIDSVVSDLNHPYEDIGKSAEKTLSDLGLTQEQILKLKAKQFTSNKTKNSLKFGADFAAREDGRSCTEPDPFSQIMRTNSLERILSAGVTHHLNAIRVIGEPLFGDSYPVLDTHTEKIIYLSDLPSGDSGRYEWP